MAKKWTSDHDFILTLSLKRSGGDNKTLKNKLEARKQIHTY
jgi:hypothetical protein